MSDLDRFEILRSGEAAIALKANRGRTNLQSYLVDIQNRYQGTELITKLTLAALEIEPFDRERGGFVKGLPLAATFFGGALPAIRLAHMYLRPDQRQAMADHDEGIKISNDLSDPKFADIQDAANVAHMQLARAGWDVAAPAFEDLYGPWTGEAYGDALKPEVFRAGFGFVIHLANQVENDSKVTQIKQLARLRAGAPWDAGVAAELVSSNPPPTT